MATGIYASSLQYGFTAIDDGGQVLENPFVQSLDWESIKGMFTSATVGMYQPLTTLLFALINAVFGHDSAVPFHLFSLLLHAVNAGLVHRVGQRLLQHDAAAFVLALLFAAHPLAVEAVCWVSATSTLLFTWCFLSRVLAYERFLANGMRGALYCESGKFALAKRDFEKVDRTPDLRFEPEKYSYLYTNLGLMTTDTEPENSLRYFKQAAEWKPQPESFENVAVAAKKLGDFETAEAFYLKYDQDFEPPSYYMNLSSLYFETQQFEKGADIMTQAIDAGCNDIFCYKMRCYFRIESQDIPGALADFDQAMVLFNAVTNAQPDPILNNLQLMLLPHLSGQ